MTKYKGNDVIVVGEHLHDDNDYVVIQITNSKGETTSDRVKKQDITPEHTERLSKHVSVATVKDEFHPKFKKKETK